MFNNVGMTLFGFYIRGREENLRGLLHDSAKLCFISSVSPSFSSLVFSYK